MYKTFATITTFLSVLIALTITIWVARRMRFNANIGFMAAMFFPLLIMNLTFFALVFRTGFYLPFMHAGVEEELSASRIIGLYPRMLIDLPIVSFFFTLIGWLIKIYVED